MRKVKRRTFAGNVLEQEIYSISERGSVKTALPRLRFKDEAERQAHKDGISKRRHARLINENYSPESLYSTLTFDVENEIHTYKEAKLIRDRFYRRLLYKYPDAKINLYIGRGAVTDRYHLHMISDGIPEEYILKQWEFGEIVRIEHLREHNKYDGVDYGQDYTGLANYLFDHWKPEFGYETASHRSGEATRSAVGGRHRYKASRNVKHPESEDPREIRREYSESKPPKAPAGYKLVECKVTRYGYMWFKYVSVANCKEAISETKSEQRE